MSSQWSSRRGAAVLSATLIALSPAPLAAQWGMSVARTQSTVRWDYRGCGSEVCVVAAQAHAPRTSVNVGVSYDRSILSWVAVQAEARLVTKGYTVTGPELNLRYLEVPLLFRFELPRRVARVTPFVVGGIAPALKLQCSLESSGCERSIIGDRRIRPFDLSGMFGGGFELRVDEHAFDLEYRLAHGWRNIGYEGGLMRNILVSSAGVSYRHLGAPDRSANPSALGGIVGAVRTLGNTCGVVHQGTGIAGEVHLRRLAGGSWWTSRLEAGGAYFPSDMNAWCTPARRSFGGSDFRTMSGYAMLGPGFVLEHRTTTSPFSPYAHATAGGFAARLDGASPGYGRVALGGALGGSVGVRFGRGNGNIATELRYQILTPVLGQRVNMVGVGVGVLP